MKRISILQGILFAFALAIAPAQATEYLNNGGFEAGDFTGWTQGGNQDFTTVVSGVSPNGEYLGPQGGSFYTYAGPADADGTLTQTFSDNAGDKLTVSGWVIGTGDAGPSHVDFLFNNLVIGSTGDPVLNQPWTQYSFSVIATGSDIFSISFRDDPSFLGLDSFSVSNISAVPEASTWAMIILGFVGIGFLSRRKAAGFLPPSTDVRFADYRL